ncbi:hypothetical protein, partial [Accumulibacter sp.]|uniref:hypothetical protein n=1 Tax=Accumulibacter sp. TaxID=2053492 RepID=UPI002602C3BB
MVIARKEPQIDLAGKAENTSFRQLVAAAFSFEQSSDAATHGQQLGQSGHWRQMTGTAGMDPLPAVG